MPRRLLALAVLVVLPPVASGCAAAVGIGAFTAAAVAGSSASRPQPDGATGRYPRDASLRVRLAEPREVTAVERDGDTLRLQAVEELIGYVVQSRADTTWLALSEATTRSGRQRWGSAVEPVVRLVADAPGERTEVLTRNRHVGHGLLAGAAVGAVVFTMLAAWAMSGAT